MRPKRKWRSVLLPAALMAGLLLFLLAGGLFFAKYLQNQIASERTTQLNEITGQVQVNLRNALDSHWYYLTAAVNELEGRSPASAQDAGACIGALERLLEMESYDAMLMLLDSQGNCYDAAGKRGVWQDIDRISGGGERYTFITDSYIYQGSYWAFVQKFDTPL